MDVEKLAKDVLNWLNDNEEKCEAEAVNQYEQFRSMKKDEKRNPISLEELARIPQREPASASLGRPISRQSLYRYLDYLQQTSDRRPIPLGEISSVFMRVLKLFEKTPCVVKINESSDPKSKIVIVGDLHGQLEDFLYIMATHGCPSERVTYIFNGDIADRGDSALEIFLTIFSFKLLYPNNVFLNRGNHEDRMLNSDSSCGGLVQEIELKYGTVGRKIIYRELLRIFWNLPLAVQIEGKKNIFVCHGGLSRVKNMYSILTSEDFDHRRAVPYVTPEIIKTDAHSLVMFDILWTDPVTGDIQGLSQSFRGHMCVNFGISVTQAFLAESGCSLLVRSHEVPPTKEGIMVTHNNRLITVFSASSYCKRPGHNSGGVLLLRPEDDVIHSDIYMARTLDEIRDLPLVSQANTDVSCCEIWYKAARVSKLNRLQAALASDILNISNYLKSVYARLTKTPLAEFICRLREIVVKHKRDLFYAYHNLDKNLSGHISWFEWEEVTRKVTGEINCPWNIFGEASRIRDPILNEVDYVKFLSSIKVSFVHEKVNINRWSEEFLTHMFSSLLNKGNISQKIYTTFDPHSVGAVSRTGFSRSVKNLGLKISPGQCEILFNSILKHCHISSLQTSKSEEVSDKILGGDVIPTSTLVLVFEKIRKQLEEHSMRRSSVKIDSCMWISTFLHQLGRWVWSNIEIRNESFVDIFREVDKDGDGFLSYEEFILSLQDILKRRPDLVEKFELTDERLDLVVQYVDPQLTGTINYSEFLRYLAPADGGNFYIFTQDIFEEICTTIHRNRCILQNYLQDCDTQGRGSLPKKSFREALIRLQLTLGTSTSITPAQIKILMGLIPRGSDKRCNVNEFLNSFQIIDTMEELRFLDDEKDWA